MKAFWRGFASALKIWPKRRQVVKIDVESMLKLPESARIVPMDEGATRKIAHGLKYGRKAAYTQMDKPTKKDG